MERRFSSCKRGTITNVRLIGRVTFCAVKYSSALFPKKSERMISWVEKIHTKPAGEPGRATTARSTLLARLESEERGFSLSTSPTEVKSGCVAGSPIPDGV